MKRRSERLGAALTIAAAAVHLAWPVVAAAADAAAPIELAAAAGQFAEMSLEELLDVEVYSVAKKKQKLSESAAAAYVLTQDDIRRSGATSIPEVLRLVPGMEVARLDSNTWAITARGFNDRFSNKLLVLIDGRSVYTPLFAGVYWDVQDTLMEDIERIEVIRGPGGTVWGANAVNGVINIITKSAKDTQGVLVSAGGGTEERHFESVRSGVELFDGGHVRVYGKYVDREAFDYETVTTLADPSDEWHHGRAGFRFDWDASVVDEVTLQGDVYDGETDTAVTNALPVFPYSVDVQDDVDVNGGNVLARWRRQLDDDSDVEIASYYDRTVRGDSGFKEERDIFDIELKHHTALMRAHDLVWGVGYRLSSDELRGDFDTAWSPSERDDDLFSGFVQDEIRLLDDDLRLTLGVKAEHNDYTGWEFQPNGRFLWKPEGAYTIWGAVSRAVRSPSRSEDDVTITGAVAPQSMLPPSLQPFIPAFAGTPCPSCDVAVRSVGNRGFDSENLISFELGFRAQPLENLALDIATYYNDYDDLRTVTITQDPALLPTSGTIGFDPVNNLNQINGFATNFGEGEAFGVEVAADWLPCDWQRFRAGYTFMDMDLHFESPDSNSNGIPDYAFAIDSFEEDGSPSNQVFLRSMTDLPRDVELDMNWRWVDRIAAVDVGGYLNFDARVAWMPTDGLELAVVGQNLIEDSHAEYGSSPFVSSLTSEVPRGVYGKVTWRP